jgi:hypothetical protein
MEGAVYAAITRVGLSCTAHHGAPWRQNRQN